MTKQDNVQDKMVESSSLAVLAQALVATPEAKAMIKKSGARSMDDLTGRDGLVATILKPFMQELLNAEMTEHLGYPKHDTSGYGTGNSRNGSYERNLRASDGPFTLDMPRDRAGNFTSAVVPPYKRISSDLEHQHNRHY
jgi:transposase-like protein